MEEIEPDADGLPRTIVGRWAMDKHERLKKYVDITRATRRKYTHAKSSSEYRGGAAYVDLFCGPGRSRIRDTEKITDGSAVVAAKSASVGKVSFTEVHVADTNNAFASATKQRITAATGFSAIEYVDTAESAAQLIAAKLNPYGLHFAFIDPYNLEGLTFETIRHLSRLRHIDLLLHLSVQDLQRNLDRYSASEKSPLDAVAPGWRTAVDLSQAKASVRAAYVAYWQSKMQELGFTHRGVELVTGPNNVRLYWLVFLSRNEFAKDLWDKIRHISGQGNLDL